MSEPTYSIVVLSSFEGLVDFVTERGKNRCESDGRLMVPTTNGLRRKNSGTSIFLRFFSLSTAGYGAEREREKGKIRDRGIHSPPLFPLPFGCFLASVMH